MPQIRHIVDENNKNVCFFIGNQKNMEYDLNKILNIFNLKAIHKPFKKNSSKNKINPLYDEAILKKIFHDDYERLFN
tara:strand:- start:636 stop:866 length:231 start_codon:yes stop_codon:yes gene_type:complete